MHRGITGTSSTQLYVGRNRRVHAAKTRVSAAGERTKQEKEKKAKKKAPTCPTQETCCPVGGARPRACPICVQHV